MREKEKINQSLWRHSYLIFKSLRDSALEAEKKSQRENSRKSPTLKAEFFMVISNDLNYI